MGERREQRTKASLPVTISGMDPGGRMFSEQVRTVDITPQGARLEGITCALQKGATILVQHKNSKARFRVMWVGEPNGGQQRQIGIHCMEEGRYIWGVALERAMGDDFERAQPARSASELPGRLRANS
jgi:hypothetical protein